MNELASHPGPPVDQLPHASPPHGHQAGRAAGDAGPRRSSCAICWRPTCTRCARCTTSTSACSSTSLRAIDGVCSELRTELRAIGSVRAPWVRAMSETRALLFVALRELIVGAHEAELSMHMPQLEPADPHRTR